MVALTLDVLLLDHGVGAALDTGAPVKMRTAQAGSTAVLRVSPAGTRRVGGAAG